ncbi:LpqC [hydrothermal vent metagenome]|uniref:LpqC n=1 Tax=hydrothermal vent metagenome TaxID=652676 RepID=A0A3B0ZUE3_9ZZZZ
MLASILYLVSGTVYAKVQTITIQHGGLQRSFILFIPHTIDTNLKSSVVFNFHGGGGRAEAYRAYTKMDATAERYKFVVVYPDGTGRYKNRLLTWNAGSCCAYANKNKIDDVGFVRKIIKQLPKYVKIDKTRIYATGFSNGGMMSYRLALELSDKIAAIASVAGNMHVEEFNPRRAFPIMHIHSVDDPRALYHGGLGPKFPFTNYRVEHRDVQEVMDLWSENNGCQKGPYLYKNLEFKTDKGTQRAEKWAYTSCIGRARVVHWKLSEVGHVWPGGKQDVMTDLLGPSTRLINANEIIWKFFSQYRLPNKRKKSH